PVLDPHPVYFREAVESVLAQTLTDLELVIVEDPSEVRGTEMIADLRDPRIRHIVNATRTSLVDQRNQGLHAARGELVALLDADDIAVPARLQKQVEYLRRHPDVDVLGSQLFIIDHQGTQVGMRSYPLSHELIVQTMSSYNALAQPSVMARKQVLLDAGGYQYRTYPVNEDYELWSRLLARGVRFANHSETLLRYRHHPLGTKTKMLHRMLRATLDVKAQFWKDEMDVWAKLRFAAEHALLGLPANVVMRLFVLTQYISGERR
ncbi:MAG: glycosyltransferase, partial [Kofleriaceae bacterium]